MAAEKDIRSLFRLYYRPLCLYASKFLAFYSHTKREPSGAPFHVDRFFAPLYLDYIHYYPFRKTPKSSYFIGAEAGGAFGMKAPDCN